MDILPLRHGEGLRHCPLARGVEWVLFGVCVFREGSRLMALGFFKTLETVSASQRLPSKAQCGACGIYRKCRSPKMPVAGDGRKDILVLGEAPGANEDEQNRPFVGKAGQLLQKELAREGIDLFHDCWVTNSLICRPPGNATPTDKEIGFCRPNVVQAINDLKPKTILLTGGSPVKSVLGWLLGKPPGALERWVGWQIPSQRLNAWVCPTWHPSYLARMEGTRDYPVLELWFRRHLKSLARLKGRPWPEEGAPDLKSYVLPVLDPDAAAEAIRLYTQDDRPVAFDYETDRKKPDHPDARIVCCAVSNGDTTIAYPWHGAAIKATRELLRSPVPKIGQNIKFEQRWTLKHLGTAVNNWVWDDMLAAHVLDNRTGITGIEFQAFVLLGQEPWDHVGSYLASKGGGNTPNKIRDCPLDKLLIYCGLDASIEWQVAQLQAKQLGVSLL